MEERQGWERPGWFLSDIKAAAVLPYDYGGNYGAPKNTDDVYADLLKLERTFNFPSHDNIVSAVSFLKLKLDAIRVFERLRVYQLFFFRYGKRRFPAETISPYLTCRTLESFTSADRRLVKR